MFNIYLFIISYLVASVSPSIMLSRKVMGTDIRKMGSGNAGTTNTLRTMGKKWGAVVFLLDISKVLISYLIILATAKVFDSTFGDYQKSLFVLASVIGHCYPIYYGFKGGKGVAVLLTSLMIVDYKATLVCLVVGIIVILITRMVSLGSILGALLAVILSIFMETNFHPFVIILTVALVIFKHRENVVRIIEGRENKIF